MSYYDLPVIHPGDQHDKVLVLKRHLTLWLRNRAHVGDEEAKKLYHAISLHRTYGTAAVQGLKYYQKHKNLIANGVCGPRTWLSFGFHEYNLLHYPGYVLKGIPWSKGVVKLDGAWINVTVARKLIVQRSKGKWGGRLTSGWRPDWYQKILWDAAVKKYGSEDAAAKWVARPGTSNHRFKDRRGAADVTRADQILRAGIGFFQPYSWEDWHLQLRAAYSVGPDPAVQEFTEAELAEVEDPTDEEVAEAEIVIRDLIANFPNAEDTHHG